MTGGNNSIPTVSTDSGRVGWLSQSRLVPLVVASALFMDLMDSAALAMALPTVARHFAVPVVELKLALTAYVVTVAVLVPTSGWLASRFGARRVFLTAMALFSLGSICCGMAETVTQLVFARVLQGIGGSMMTPVGRIIMVASVPRENLVRGMAWYTLPAILAPLVGPPVAGALIEFADWRWIFFINIPVGICGMLAVLRFVPVLAPTRRPRFDLPGFLLAGASILAIMTLVETSALAGQPVPLRLLAVAGAGLIAVIYVRQALHAKEPIADFHVLRHGSLRWSLISTWLHRIAMGGVMVLLPLQLQIGLGHTPLMSSQVMVCAALGSVVSRFLCPFAIRRLGFRRLMLCFGAVTTLLSLAPAGFGLTTPIAVMAGVMLVHAAIRASFFMAGNTLSYCDVQGEEIGHASVLFAMSQQLSLGFGYSFAAMILDAAGGPHDLSAFGWAYAAMVGLQFAGTLAILPLSTKAGENMRMGTSA
jgi:EmrB/QacA subfamily drug resistance transporter